MYLDKVVPHLNLFPTIFYFQFLEHGNTPFGSVKFREFWICLNHLEYFWFSLNRFKTEPDCTVLPGPLVSAPRRATPLPLTPFRTPPMATGPRYRWSWLSAARTKSLAPRRPPLSCGNGTACARRPGSIPAARAVPRRARGLLSLLRFPLHAAPNAGPPAPFFLSAQATGPP
jgi:hypothetical protein